MYSLPREWSDTYLCGSSSLIDRDRSVHRPSSWVHEVQRSIRWAARSFSVRLMLFREGLNKSPPAGNSRVFSMARSARAGLIQTFPKAEPAFRFYALWAQDSPHLSDRSKNISEERLLLQHLGEAMHQRAPASHHALWAADHRACSPGGTTNARVA